VSDALQGGSTGAGAVAGERLGWAIFIAAAAHGLLILGVGFAPPDREDPAEVPTLEVTLLEAPPADERAPDNARYLAQANQEGAGNTRETLRPEFHERPPAPAAPDPATPGPDAERLSEAPQAPAAERIASWNAPLQAIIAPLPEEHAARPAEAPPEGGLTRVSADEPREHFISLDTRESLFAEYLAGWHAQLPYRRRRAQRQPGAGGGRGGGRRAGGGARDAFFRAARAGPGGHRPGTAGQPLRPLSARGALAVRRAALRLRVAFHRRTRGRRRFARARPLNPAERIY